MQSDKILGLQRFPTVQIQITTYATVSFAQVSPSHVCTSKLESVHTPKADATALILSQLDVTPMRIFVTEIGNDTDIDRLELIVFWVPHCLTSYSYYILFLRYSTSLVFRCAPCSHSCQITIIRYGYIFINPLVRCASAQNYKFSFAESYGQCDDLFCSLFYPLYTESEIIKQITRIPVVINNFYIIENRKNSKMSAYPHQEKLRQTLILLFL